MMQHYRAVPIYIRYSRHRRNLNQTPRIKRKKLFGIRSSMYIPCDKILIRTNVIIFTLCILRIHSIKNTHSKTFQIYLYE